MYTNGIMVAIIWVQCVLFRIQIRFHQYMNGESVENTYEACSVY